MYVLATAGHVDHGKSTLVNALTGMQPDRWEEEQRRGLTIDLGFAWTTLPSGRDLAFVDVPGHERFLGNMLAGIGPAPAVMLVVAADEGWQAQTTDHLDALNALGKSTGLVVLSRADRADEARRKEVTAEIRRRLAHTSLAQAPICAVSAHTGEGMDVLRRSLDEVLDTLPAPNPDARTRLWIDRAFSISGAGTVITGTLTAGTLRRGDEVELLLKGQRNPQRATIRGLQSEEEALAEVGPTRRVAVNLRGIEASQIRRGDLLLAPIHSWPLTDSIDVRRLPRISEHTLDEAPQELAAHIGTLELQVRLRPFGKEHARLQLPYPLPLQITDRLVLRAPGHHAVFSGVEVIDLSPAPLARRGDAARHQHDLEEANFADPNTFIHRELTRHGILDPQKLARAGVTMPAHAPAGITQLGRWWVAERTLDELAQAARAAAETSDPLHPGASKQEITKLLPTPELYPEVLRRAGLQESSGRVLLPGAKVNLGRAEEAIATIEEWLGEDPFNAPDATELRELNLGPRELAAAAKAGRILRLPSEIVLLPSAPAAARQVLKALPQPFTLSAGRKALNTTRRVAVPFLEYLDSVGITRKVDAHSGARVVCD